MSDLKPIDVIVCLLAVLSAYNLQRRRSLLPRGAGWRAGFGLLVAGLLTTEFAWHGLHWQMFPALLVLAVCAVGVLLRFGRQSSTGMRFLSLVLMEATVVSAMLLYVLPLFTLPAPTGPYAVGTRTEHWVDPATGRPLAVQIWYPAEAAAHLAHARYARLRELKPRFVYFHWIRTNSLQDAPVARAGAPFPVLLYGHMWDGRRTQDTFLTEDLASHGYVVVSMDHPGNAALMERADGSVLRSDRAAALDRVEADGVKKIRRIWADELVLWTADNEYVLNQLAAGRAGWLAGRADFTRVGAFGHSFGGSAALALLGTDPRVRCAINIDGWSFEGLAHRTTEPMLILYEARDEGMAGGRPTDPSVEAQLERSDQDLIDRSAARTPLERAYVRGTQHADFTDATLYSPVERLTYTGPIAPVRVRTIVRGLVLGFFNQNLKGLATPATYPEVQVRK